MARALDFAAFEDLLLFPPVQEELLWQSLENGLARVAGQHQDHDQVLLSLSRRLDNVALRLRAIPDLPSSDHLSHAERLSLLSSEDREQSLRSIPIAELLSWRFWARPKQLPPPGDWAAWVIRAGRGFGKTRTASGWIHERAMAQPGRWIALVARTPADARDYNIEGPGGILRNTPEDERPLYEPSKRRLTWRNSSWATIYSDEEPDQLRGFSGDTACLDEFGKYKHPREVWDNLMLGMREASNDQPRVMIPTTPRPLPVLLEIERLPDTVVTRGSSYENRANLDPSWFSRILSRYEGTRLGRQEIHAEILEDTPGALWTRNLIDHLRVHEAPELKRIVVAIDPTATSNEDSDDAGIMVGGRGIDDHAYVFQDLTVEQASPAMWGRRAVAAYRENEADRIVAEVNNGGEMVEFVLRTIDPNVSYRSVWASRGKRTRAEPVSALYEQGRVHHVGSLTDLEDELCTWVPGMASPNRLDALVWLITELMADLMQNEKTERQPPRVYFPGMHQVQQRREKHALALRRS